MEERTELDESTCRLVARADAELVLQDFNDTDVDYPRDRLIHELFERQVEESPDACAIICGDRRMTYGELNARANQIARELMVQGLRLEDRAGVCAERGLEMIIGMLAVLKAGGAYVPLDPQYPADRRTFMCKDSSLTAILTTSDRMALVADHGLPLIPLDQEAMTAEANPSIPMRSSRNLAYVIYTSGSSGVPKGVMVEHRSVVRLVVGARFAELHPDDCIAHCASPSFDAATWEIWGALLNGARVLIVGQRELLSAPVLNDLLMRHAVTAMFLTVGLFHKYVDELEEAFGDLRYLLVGGDVVIPAIAGLVLKKSTRPKHFLNAYGPTETTTFATTFLISSEATAVDALPIGRPITNTRVYVLDENRAPLPIGEVGELFIGGPGVARGYLNRPELTKERFLDDPFWIRGERMYKTGDLGRWRPDGNLEFLGRSDFQVKVRGFRVEPGEIEIALQRHPSIKQAIVIAREDEPGEKRLVAYVVTQPLRGAASPEGGLPEVKTSDASVDVLAELRDFLTQSLPQYMVPAAFVLLEEFPLTSNGKIDRAALPPPEDGFWRRADQAPPQSSMEIALAEVWMRKLKQKHIGLDDNFFELGGDSMMGLQLIAEVEEHLGVQGLSVIALFEYPTIREMAQFVQAIVAEASGSSSASP